MPSLQHNAMKVTRDAFVDWQRTRLNGSTEKAEWPRRCLRPGGTLWFFGNSVARVHYFAALALLNGEDSKGIDEQIALCGKGGEWRGRRPGQGLSCLGPCMCSSDIAGGRGRLVFVWQQRMYHPTDELARALSSSASDIGNRRNGTAIRIEAGDAVIVNIGLDDIVSLAKYASGKRRAKERHRDGSAWTLVDYLQKWQAELANNAPGLASGMAAAWRQRRAAFWRTSTPVCHAPAYRTHWGLLTGPRALLSDSSDGQAAASLSNATLQQGHRAPASTSRSRSGISSSISGREAWAVESTTVNDLLAHSDASVAEEMQARRVPILEIAHIDRSAVVSAAGTSCGIAPAAARAPAAPAAEPAASTASASAAAGSTAASSTRFACRCSGYNADHTNLHPNPQVALEQVRQMLAAMSTECSRAYGS